MNRGGRRERSALDERGGGGEGGKFGRSITLLLHRLLLLLAAVDAGSAIDRHRVASRAEEETGRPVDADFQLPVRVCPSVDVCSSRALQTVSGAVSSTAVISSKKFTDKLPHQSSPIES